jgi:hypothetical protein
MQRIFIKKCFLFTVGSFCRVKRFTTEAENSLKVIRKSQMMPDQVQKWLRQQPKDFCATGINALGKQWDVCQCWWRICREIKVLFVFEYLMFYFLYPFVTYFLTLPRRYMFALSCQYTNKITLKLTALVLNRAGIATGYGLDDQGVGVRVPVGARIFSSLCRPDRLWGPPSLLSNGHRGLFPRG